MSDLVRNPKNRFSRGSNGSDYDMQGHVKLLKNSSKEVYSLNFPLFVHICKKKVILCLHTNLGELNLQTGH